MVHFGVHFGPFDGYSWKVTTEDYYLVLTLGVMVENKEHINK